MKFTASFAFGLGLCGIASALPAVLDEPSELVARDANHTELVARGGCSPPYIANVQIVGGNGGGQFCSTKWPGPILPQTLTTYSKGKDVIGLEIIYTDGSNERHGTGFNTANSGSITLAPGELITEAWLAGNGIGTRLGKIHLVTNKGQTKELGTSDAPNTYEVNVGSGLLVGLVGNSGDAIDCAGLFFVDSKITNIDIGNMQLNAGQLSNAQGQVATAAFTDQVHYFNDGTSGNQTFMFQNSRTVTSSTTVSQSTTGTIGQTITFSVEFDIPEIAKLSVSNAITWSVAHTTGTEATSTEAYTAQYQQGGTLAPQTGVDCTAIVWKGSGTFDYTSTVTYHFANGQTYSYPESGQLSTQQYTQGQSTCKPTTVNATPQNYAVGKTVKQT